MPKFYFETAIKTSGVSGKRNAGAGTGAGGVFSKLAGAGTGAGGQICAGGRRSRSPEPELRSFTMRRTTVYPTSGHRRILRFENSLYVEIIAHLRA